MRRFFLIIFALFAYTAASHGQCTLADADRTVAVNFAVGDGASEIIATFGVCNGGGSGFLFGCDDLPSWPPPQVSYDGYNTYDWQSINPNNHYPRNCIEGAKYFFGDCLKQGNPAGLCIIEANLNAVRCMRAIFGDNGGCPWVGTPPAQAQTVFVPAIPIYIQ